jgi:fructoselysine-6-P-deglycase FrlB-like protein
MVDLIERFLEDVLAEPRTLAALLDAYEGPESPLGAVDLADVRRVVLVGMGSSRFASLAAASYLRARGVDAHVELASAGAPLPAAPGTLAVCVSSSGKTAETVEAALRHRGTSRVVAVTNRPESELAAAADAVLPLLAGDERGGIACKSYQCTVAALLLLAARLTGETLDVRPAVESVVTLQDTRGRWRDRALELLGGGPTYLLAPAERLSSAEQSALVLREAPRIPADACETGDWLHVDVYLTKRPGYRAILFPGSRFDGAVMEWMARRGGEVVAIGRRVEGAALTVSYPGAGDPLVATLVETSAVELLAAELWSRSAT